MKKFLTPLLVLGALLVTAVPVSAAAVCPTLPSGVVFAEWQYPNAPLSYFTITLSSAGDLNGLYDGWCVDIHHTINPTDSNNVLLKCTYDPTAAGLVDIPANLGGVNWLLNNNPIGTSGPGGTYTWADVQATLWQLLESGSVPSIGQNAANVAALVAAAIAHNSFESGVGQLVAVFVNPGDAQGVTVKQISLITVLVAGGSQGCTPGYWKANADKWGAVSWIVYHPGDDFNTVFGIPEQILNANGKAKYTNPTLRQALDANGSGINLLARAATAALLNATNPNIQYPWTAAHIIAAVQAAVASGSSAIQALGSQLDTYNNLGCTINQQGEPIVFQTIS